jgi:hypothetical protein
VSVCNAPGLELISAHRYDVKNTKRVGPPNGKRAIQKVRNAGPVHIQCGMAAIPTPVH